MHKIKWGDGVAEIDPDDGHGPIAKLRLRRTYTQNTAELKANAHLFAAAPDLLAACERVLRAHDENWRVDRMDFPPINDVRSAIAKAKGE